MKKLLSYLSLILFISSCFSFQTSYDLKLSPQCGAENLSTIHYNVEKADFFVLKSIKQPEENNLKKIINGIDRFLELSFIWQPLNDYLVTIQHEFFGHGYRIRDFGKNTASIIKYKIYKPYPFGDSGGYTSFYYNKFTPFDESAISIAGTEATSIFAREIKLNWLKNDYINPLQASLYLESMHDITIYTLSSLYLYGNYDIEGHDILSYLDSLCEIYPGSAPSTKKIKNMARLNLIDPFTYLSIYSYVKYIITGKNTSIPMFNMNGIKYLPSFKFGLTPFGPEVYFENFFLNKKGPIYVYIKRGKYWENTFSGMGFKAPYLYVKNHLSLGLKMDLWNQPIFLKTSNAKDNIDDIYYFNFSLKDLTKKRPGCSLAMISSYQVKNYPLYFDCTIGYKTKGFVPGESINNAPVFKIGLSGTF